MSACLFLLFLLPDWMLFLMRIIYCSPVPSGADLSSSNLKKKNRLSIVTPSSYTLFLIMPFSLSFILLFPFLFHLLSNNQPSPSSLASLSPTAGVSCISHPSPIFLLCHLCGPLLLMYERSCTRLARLLDSSAPEAEGSVSWVLDANPVSCWVTDFLFSQMTPALGTGWGRAELRIWGLRVFSCTLVSWGTMAAAGKA